MTTRDQMLAAIQANQPDLIPLPDTFRFGVDYPDLLKQFTDVLTGIGGKVIEVADYEAITAHLQTYYGSTDNWATTLPELAHLADVDLATITDPHDLARLNLAIIGGELGVAENGAIWVDERHLPHRALPMITQYLAIVIRQSRLVSTMHDAYDRITVNQTGFGTFIAGPSKTADIEQSLVIGAHGARGLTVYVMLDLV
jgi:L-lactate dehydrogenase complex protein LldG